MNNDGMKRILILFLTFALASSFIVALAPTSSAALYTNWVNETPSMEDQAQALVVADNENGNVYIVGGAAGVEVAISYKLDTCNVTVYNVESGTSWHASPMPTGVRAASGGMGDDGRIYVFGGYNGSIGVVSATQIYDIATDSWSTGTAPPTAYSFATCAVDWPYFYVMGGVGSNLVQIYDAISDSWSPGTALPAIRWAGQAVYHSGEYAIYYIGGTNSWGSSTSSVYRYSLSYDTWDTVSSLPVSRAGLGAVVGIDGMIYAAGGSDQAYNVLGNVFADTYYYNPSNDTWSYISDLNQPRKYLGLVAMEDGLMLALDGNNETMTYSVVESIRTIEATITVSSSTVAQGNSFLLSLNFESSYATDDFSLVSYYLESSTGVVYPWNMAQFNGADCSISILIPDIMPVGSYELYVECTIVMETIAWYPPEVVIGITVEATVPISQQISDLQGQIDDLQAQLDALNATAGQSTNDISDQIDGLQNDLDQTNTDVQKSIDAANAANSTAMLAMILALIAVILIVVNIVLSLRKKS